MPSPPPSLRALLRCASAGGTPPNVRVAAASGRGAAVRYALRSAGLTRTAAAHQTRIISGSNLPSDPVLSITSQ